MSKRIYPKIDPEKQQEILTKILNILGITSDKDYFLLCELDIDMEKQQAILDLQDDIKRNFVHSKWTCFIRYDLKRQAFSIIKYVLRDMGYLFFGKNLTNIVDGTKKTLYHCFIKKV